MLLILTRASELWEFLPKDNKQISMYSEEDVPRYKDMLPSDPEITCKSFGISSIHEIMFSLLDDNQLSWKKVSADTEYTNVSLLKYQARTEEARTIKWKQQIKVKKRVSFSPEKNIPYGIFSIPAFFMFCIAFSLIKCFRYNSRGC